MMTYILLVLLNLVFAHDFLDPEAFTQVCSGEIRSELEDKIGEFTWLIHRYSTGIETSRSDFNEAIQLIFGNVEAILIPNDIHDTQSYYVFAESIAQLYDNTMWELWLTLESALYGSDQTICLPEFGCETALSLYDILTSQYFSIRITPGVGWYYCDSDHAWGYSQAIVTLTENVHNGKTYVKHAEIFTTFDLIVDEHTHSTTEAPHMHGSTTTPPHDHGHDTTQPAHHHATTGTPHHHATTDMPHHHVTTSDPHHHATTGQPHHHTTTEVPHHHDTTHSPHNHTHMHTTTEAPHHHHSTTAAPHDHGDVGSEWLLGEFGLYWGDVQLIDRVDTESIATATFSSETSGIEGEFIVQNGELNVNLDFSGLFNSNDSDIEPECYQNGLSYHAHMMWAHSGTEGIADTELCGSAYIGGHYDPYLTCGPHSGNTLCATCLGASSGGHDHGHGHGHGSTDSNYTCSETFLEDPFTCETGDWIGKYGALVLDENFQVTLNAGSLYSEFNGADLAGRSLVLHCTDDVGTRIACAPFQISYIPTIDTSRDTLNSAATISSLTAILDFKVDSDDDRGSSSSWSGWGSRDRRLLDRYESGNPQQSEVTFYSNSKYSIDLDLEDYERSIEDLCNNYILRLDMYHYSDVPGDDNCYAGAYYDPTLSCPLLNSAEDCTCIRDNSNYLCDYNSDTFSCSMGDLSGKYGYFDIRKETYSLNGYDFTLPILDELQQKVIVLSCANNNTNIVACGQLN